MGDQIALDDVRRYWGKKTKLAQGSSKSLHPRSVEMAEKPEENHKSVLFTVV